MAGFNTAITGLKAATTDLDVTGNNIANSSTIGFKSSRTEFGDIYATAVVGAGSSNVAGSGVTVTDIAQDFQAGTIEFTNNNLDLAINGSGFFQLDDGQGGTTYTRGGAFELDKDGLVVSKSGKFLQGYGLDSQGNRLPIGNLAVSQKESPPKATEDIDLSFNIDSRADATKLLPDYDKDEPGSFSYSTTMRTFDSLGNEHTIKFNMVEARPFQAQQNLSFTDRTAGTKITVSGVSERPGPFDITVADLFAPDPSVAGMAARQAIMDGDPRIEDIIITNGTGTTGTITLSFKSEYPEPDLVTVGGDAATIAQVTVAETTEIAANETHTYGLADDAFGGVLPSDALAAVTDIEIGGVAINLDAGLTRDKVGETIATFEAQILDKNPDVQSVIFDEAANQIQVTFKAESGNVNNAILAVVDPTVGGTGSSLLSAATIKAGDDSFEGVYRMYAYLNGDEQLNLGKSVDPGEAGFVNSPPSTEVGPILIKFNSTNGLLNSINGSQFSPGAAAPSISITGADPADPTTTITLDIANTTQFASASIVKASNQDGYTKGDLIGVTFADTGEMVASFSNGQNQNLGVVAFATFENQSGLQPSGDTEWTATLTSGGAILNPPGTGLNGSLRSAALEQSNVDLSTELVKLIEAQRNFQANSKTLETLNTVTQSILQI